MRQVGIHLRSYPIPSEAFVTEQARTLRRYTPTVFARDILAGNDHPAGNIRTSKISSTISRKIFALHPRTMAWGGPAAFSGIDLIHAHFGPNGTYALPLARELHIPLIVSFHGFDATLSQREWISRQGIFGLYYLLHRRKLANPPNKLLAVSQFIRHRLLSIGFSDDAIVQHYIGVDLEKFSPIPAEARIPDIVCVGRLTRSKGIGTLIQAFARIHTLIPSTQLRIIGAGPSLEEFRQLANDYGVAAKTKFEGTMPHAQVAALVRQCALSVLVSQTGEDGWQEAFGLASIEAAACGLPVVVSAHGGLPETIIDGLTGLIVPERDVSALATALHDLMRDDDARREMGAAGRVHVEQNFNIVGQTAKLEDTYDMLLNR